MVCFKAGRFSHRLFVLKYLYRLMDTVIFHDFETALDVVIEDFKEAHNDNNKKISYFRFTRISNCAKAEDASQ